MVFETDAANLVKAMQTTEYDLAPEGVLYRDLKSFIRLNFLSASFCFAPRTCNKIAHELARWGVNQTQDRLLWPGGVTTFVNVLVASESAEPI